MIPSKYLFPVVALVLVWASSLLAVYEYTTKPSAPNAPLEYQLELYDQLSNTLTEYEHYAISKFEQTLEDDAKARFRPLLIPVIESETLMSRFQETSRQAIRSVNKTDFDPTLAQLQLRKVAQEASDVALEMVAMKNTLLTEKGHEFDLNKENITLSGERQMKKALAIDKAKYFLNDAPTSYTDFLHRIRAIKLSIKSFQSDFNLNTMAIAGGKVIQCFVTYEIPMLAQPNAIAKKGEPLVLPIGVGLIDLALLPENVDFIIDGKRYPMGKNGRLYYEASTKQRGLNALPVTLAIRNPLTGAERTTDSVINYYVR